MKLVTQNGDHWIMAVKLYTICNESFVFLFEEVLENQLGISARMRPDRTNDLWPRMHHNRIR